MHKESHTGGYSTEEGRYVCGPQERALGSLEASLQCWATDWPIRRTGVQIARLHRRPEHLRFPGLVVFTGSLCCL